MIAFLFLVFFVIVDCHFIALGPICIGFFFSLFFVDYLLLLFLWMCLLVFFICLVLLMGWVPILDFLYMVFLICLVLLMDGFLSLIFYTWFFFFAGSTLGCPIIILFFKIHFNSLL